MNVNREKPKLRLKLGGGSSEPQDPAPMPVPKPTPPPEFAPAAGTAEQKAEVAARILTYEKGREELKRRATAMLTALAERWPQCFDLQRPRPLKIAIHKDIIAEMWRAETDLAFETDLRVAMRLYTGSPAYLMALVEGAVRIDLNGEPSGLVKAPHAGFAKYRLRRMEGR